MSQRVLTTMSATEAAQPLTQEYFCKDVLTVQTPDKDFDRFVNDLLPRQILGDATGEGNPPTDDVITHNSLQSILGMCYVQPDMARQALLTAIAQLSIVSVQKPDENSSRPEFANIQGVTGHLVWLPLALELYLSETADYSILTAPIETHDPQDPPRTVLQQICLAMDSLFASRDKYGLSYIGRGDWLSSLDGIGHKGSGVSGWVTLATAHALSVWAKLYARHSQDTTTAEKYAGAAAEVKKAAITHLWDGEWFLRGITDDGVLVGTNTETEGRIWLDVQSWAIISCVATPDKIALLLAQVESQLGMPEDPGAGTALCGPPYYSTRDDIGRLTQEPAISAENGDQNSHATIWHAYSLYSIGKGGSAFDLLRSLSFESVEAQASCSMDTATASWTYRTIVEGLLGLSGNEDGLSIHPQLPSGWNEATVERRFRGATFNVHIKRAIVEQTTISVDGLALITGRITNIRKGRSYKLEVLLSL